MGGICPCLAGVPPAQPGPKTRGAKNQVDEEKQPLLPSTNKPLQPPEEALPVLKLSGKTLPANEQPGPPPTYTMSPTDFAAKDRGNADAPSTTMDTTANVGGVLGIDSFLDIYSNSNQSWCPGVIAGVDGSSILVAYQAPSSSPTEPNISTKMLPIDSPEIRRPLDSGPWLGAVVDVFSTSNEAWCKGVIQKIEKGVAMIAYFYPNAPPGSEPAFKTLTLGDQDLRLPGAEYAMAAVQAVGGELFTSGAQVEVYSNSLQVWCPGTVKCVQAGVISVEFYYPDMDPNTQPPVLKELPVGHQDIRLVVATGTTQVMANVDPNVKIDDFVVGNPIDVYSQSRQIWISAVIQDVSNGCVTAAFRYPDMPADSEELFQKVLPAGHPDFRLPHKSQPS